MVGYSNKTNTNKTNMLCVMEYIVHGSKNQNDSN